MLETLDLSRSLSHKEYRTVLDPLEIRMGELQRALRAAQVPTLVVFEGWDAAGKGTCIGALVQPLDPRGYKVHPHRPPKGGDDCLFIHQVDDTSFLGLAKTLVRAGTDKWRVRQFNPEREFDLDRRKWIKAWKIVGKMNRM